MGELGKLAGGDLEIEKKKRKERENSWTGTILWGLPGETVCVGK